MHASSESELTQVMTAATEAGYAIEVQPCSGRGVKRPEDWSRVQGWLVHVTSADDGEYIALIDFDGDGSIQAGFGHRDLDEETVDLANLADVWKYLELHG